MPLSNVDLQNNKIDGTPVEFTNSNITISGNHNTIKFGQNFKARNFDIRIEGDNSTIIFGNNCYFTGRVWCARDVILMKGTVLGNDVVVAARSLVNGKFGNNIILAGTPAKVIREQVVWTEQAEASFFPLTI